MNKINIIFVLFFVVFEINCIAQSPIIDLNNRNGERISNVYYKDTNNLLNQFEGTYVLDDGVNYLKIVFQKKEMEFIGNIYEDVLIGEYQYKHNGIEIINTLNKLQQSFPNYSYHSIDGNHFLYNNTPFNDYTTENFRLSMGMSIPNGLFADLDVRKCFVNGQEAIQIFKRTTYYHLKDTPVPPVIVPNGFFYLIKE